MPAAAQRAEPPSRYARSTPASAPEPTVALDTHTSERAASAWLLPAVAAIVVVGLAAAVFLVGDGLWWGKRNLGSERDRVVAAAKQEVPLVTSYDYRKLDPGLKAALALTTGNFTKELTQTWNTLIKVSAPQVKAVQTVSATEAGIESLSRNGRQALVLVFGQGSVTSANTSPSGSPRLDLLSVRVTLDLVRGKWLIAELDQVG
jgi:hypothetical protein